MHSLTNVWEKRDFASEWKFLIGSPMANAIRDYARRHLKPDPNADPALGDGYRTSTLYFDTPSLDVLTQNGSYARAKYRVRRYGDADWVYLERKLRARYRVTKRRTAIPVVGLESLEGGAWFERRLALRRLRPVCQVSYTRTALMRMDSNGPIRLTIDRDLTARLATDLRFAGMSGGVPFYTDQEILELKFRGPMPGLFKELVGEFALIPEKASKYRTAMASLQRQDSLIKETYA